MFNSLRRLLTFGVGASEAVVTGYRRPMGYQQISSGTLATATALTVPTLTGQLPGYIIVQANGGIVRWRDDGTAPTSSVGMSIPDGGELNYVGDLYKIKFILSTSSPTLDISYYV